MDCIVRGVSLHGAHGFVVFLAQYCQERDPPGLGPEVGMKEGGFVQ